jgi:hypothetical protein
VFFLLVAEISCGAETEYDKMIQEKQMSICEGCEGERPAYPAPAPQDVPATSKKNIKR